MPVSVVASANPELGIELLSARAAARFCNISVRQWWRWDSEGVIPKAVRIGKTKRWRLTELLAWISAGCPRRKEWEAQQ